MVSVLLLTGYAALYVAGRIKKIVGQQQNLPTITIGSKKVMVKKIIGNAVTLAIGLMLGWLLHSAHQFNHTYVLNDVKVIRRQSDSFYLLQTDHHVDFTFKACPDSKIDWLEGSTLKVLVYEDRGSCASISDKRFGYLVKRNSAGEPILNGGS